MIVTISREYGAGGFAVAHGTADALRYALVTDDLPRAVAARLGTSSDEVAARATGGASLGERILRGLDAATPEAPHVGASLQAPDFDASVRAAVEQQLRERAAGGDAVILGRLANAVLSGTPGLVRVFLHAPRAWRVANLARTFASTHAEAAADVDRIDAARRRIARERYGFSFGDPHWYDVVVDTARFGVDGTVAVVVAAVAAAEAR